MSVAQWALPVPPGGNGARLQVACQQRRHLFAGGSVVVRTHVWAVGGPIFLEVFQAQISLVLTDTRGASDAQWPFTEEKQRAQRNLQDRRREKRQKWPRKPSPPHTHTPRVGVIITIWRLVHDMVAGWGLSDQQLHLTRLYTLVFEEWNRVTLTMSKQPPPRLSRLRVNSRPPAQKLHAKNKH